MLVRTLKEGDRMVLEIGIIRAYVNVRFARSGRATLFFEMPEAMEARHEKGKAVVPPDAKNDGTASPR